MQWDDGDIWSKSEAGKQVSLIGVGPQTVTLDNISISGNGSTLRTSIRAYSGATHKLVYASPLYGAGMVKKSITGGMYTIKNVLSNYVIDIPGYPDAANTVAIQYSSHGEANQKFMLKNVGNGEFKIEPMHSAGYDMALGLNGSKQLILDTDTNTASKRWYIENISGDNYRIVNKAYPTEYLSVNGNTSLGANVYSSSNTSGAVWQFTPVETDVSVRVLYEDSFYDMASLNYGNAEGRANYLFDTAVQAYIKRWGLKLNRTSTERSMETFTAYNCPLGLYTPCDSGCIKPADSCSIDLCRHKCSYTFLHELSDKCSMGSYDLLTMFHGFQSLCASGIAYRTGTYSAICYYPDNTTWTIRTIQHEISHNFGTYDNGKSGSECTGPCIMNSGFNGNSNFDDDNIWCSKCKKDFMKNKFQ
jgi:hypothetical protein